MRRCDQISNPHALPACAAPAQRCPLPAARAAQPAPASPDQPSTAQLRCAALRCRRITPASDRAAAERCGSAAQLPLTLQRAGRLICPRWLPPSLRVSHERCDRVTVTDGPLTRRAHQRSSALLALTTRPTWTRTCTRPTAAALRLRAARRRSKPAPLKCGLAVLQAHAYRDRALPALSHADPRCGAARASPRLHARIGQDVASCGARQGPAQRCAALPPGCARHSHACWRRPLCCARLIAPCCACSFRGAWSGPKRRLQRCAQALRLGRVPHSLSAVSAGTHRVPTHATRI